MLKAIMKRFDSKPKEELMTSVVEQPALAAPEMAATLASTLEAMASQAEAFAAVSEALAELTTKYETAQAALDAVEAAKALLVADAKTARMSARKAAVVAAVGTVKADALLEATESLNDVAFGAVVAAMTVNLETESKQVMFKEVGVSATSAAPEVVEQSEESKILRAKYQTNKGTK